MPPAPHTSTIGSEPERNCSLCARLVQFRQQWREIERGWHNAPVPSFGPLDARLLIVGLAPGLRGANATGRPFTGDYAGDLLYRMLLAHGFAVGTYRAMPDDGLMLNDCRITNAVRCVPPQNKPETVEIARCRPFLETVIGEMPKLEIILALGQIAHQSVVRAHGERASRYPFRHGGAVALGAKTLLSSYHCSRYNTNTGVLTDTMFARVFADIRERLGS